MTRKSRTRKACPPGCVKKSTNPSHKQKSARKASRKKSRKASRKKSRKVSRKKSRKVSRKKSRKVSRKAPPSGIIKKQKLAVGETMAGMDGNMYEVVEIEMMGKKVRKWKKSKKVGM